MARKTMIKYSHEGDKKMKKGMWEKMKYSCRIRSSIKYISVNSVPFSSSSKLVKLTVI